MAPLLPGPTGCVSGSRFRVVKLDHGLGEPYKRGRWTCRDFYEHEMDHHVVGRLADSARQPQSLDSRLEVAGLLAKPSSPFSPPLMPRQGGPCLQSLLVLPGAAASAHQARSLGGGLPVLRPGRTLPSAASLQSPRLAAETRPLAPEEGAQEPGDPPQLGTIPLVRVEGHLLPKSVTQLIPRETEERQKVRTGRHVTCRGGSWAPTTPLPSPQLGPRLGESPTSRASSGLAFTLPATWTPLFSGGCPALSPPPRSSWGQLFLLTASRLPLGRDGQTLDPSGAFRTEVLVLRPAPFRNLASCGRAPTSPSARGKEGWGTSKVWGCTSPRLLQ